ncbi:hypothetical protein SMA67_26275, partial [Escherichia coli]|uniref:hypothetical protein n=1 Tax=Escherichia coli TaxID=562 RepID=UPI00307AC37C
EIGENENVDEEDEEGEEEASAAVASSADTRWMLWVEGVVGMERLAHGTGAEGDADAGSTTTDGGCAGLGLVCCNWRSWAPMSALFV